MFRVDCVSVRCADFARKPVRRPPWSHSGQPDLDSVTPTGPRTAAHPGGAATPTTLISVR